MVLNITCCCSCCVLTNTFLDSAGQLRRIANLMLSSGMEVPAWMLHLKKEHTVLKQRLKDENKKGQHPHHRGLSRAKRRRISE